jgi:hypothetical protein
MGKRTKAAATEDRQNHIDHLFAAELQFRLASAVRLATTGKQQPLDLPMEWTHGRHRVRHEEIALRQDQADYAAFLIHRSATYVMAVAIKDGIEAIVPNLTKAVQKTSKDANAIRKAICALAPKPWKSSGASVVAAYQIARLIRNAYSHAPFAPRWMVHPDLRGKTFSIPDVIALDTANLHGSLFDWRHYGGPLAMFRFCRFVRGQILGDQLRPRKLVPIPKNVIYQQGDMIFTKVDKIPPEAVRVPIKRLPDGGIPLGGEHVIYPNDRSDA